MLEIIADKCLLCCGCIASCPEMALEMSRVELKVDMDRCTLCKICVRFCPVAALTLKISR